VPDLLVVPDAALRKGGKALPPADVLLVVEVLSPGNAGRDLVVKRHEHALAGIPRYWIVDQKQQTITVLRLTAGRYVEDARLLPGETWRTEEPFPLGLDPVEVF
jgi:Uma2 family endonuclease